MSDAAVEREYMEYDVVIVGGGLRILERNGRRRGSARRGLRRRGLSTRIRAGAARQIARLARLRRERRLRRCGVLQRLAVHRFVAEEVVDARLHIEGKQRGGFLRRQRLSIAGAVHRRSCVLAV